MEKVKKNILLIIVWISCIVSWFLEMPYKIIPLGIEMLCAFIIILKAIGILKQTKIIKAYNVYGGGAYPTQFYWNDRLYHYYFRLRNGKYRLYKGRSNPDTDLEFFKKSKVIAEGEYGDDIEGYIKFVDMRFLLMKHGIILNIKGKPNLKELDFSNINTDDI